MRGGRKPIAGYNLAQMITYVSVGWIIRSFYWNTIDQEMAYEVIEGKIAMDLIKPVSIQWMWICRAMGESAFRLVLLTLPTAIVVRLIFPVQRAGFARGFPAVSASPSLGSFFLMGAINFMIGTCAIPLKSILALIRAKYWLIELLSGLLIPMAFFPEKVQTVLAWLPFEHIAYTPLQIYLGKLDRAQRAARLGARNGPGWSRCCCWRISGGTVRCRRSRFREARLAQANRISRFRRWPHRPAGNGYRPNCAAMPCSSSTISRSTPKCASAIAAIFSSAWPPVLPRRFSRWASWSCCSKKFRSLADWRFEEVLFLYGFSLIPYGMFNVLSPNLYDFGNNTSSKANSTACCCGRLLAVSGALRNVSHRIDAGNCHRAFLHLVGRRIACISPGRARKSLLLILLRLCAGRDLRFGLSDAHHRFLLVRGPHRRASAGLELIAFGRYPLSIYSGFVQFFLCWIIPFGLASFYPSVRLLGRARYRPIRAAGAGGRRRLPGHRHFALESGHAPLLLHRLLDGRFGMSFTRCHGPIFSTRATTCELSVVSDRVMVLSSRCYAIRFWCRADCDFTDYGADTAALSLYELR